MANRLADRSVVASQQKFWRFRRSTTRDHDPDLSITPSLVQGEWNKFASEASWDCSMDGEIAIIGASRTFFASAA
jgi:hypothetical protein